MKLKEEQSRKQKIHSLQPYRQEVFVLYNIKKPVTMIHAFRLAEGLGARVWFIGNGPTNALTTLQQLDELFPRWRSVPWSQFHSIDEFAKRAKTEHLRLVILEITQDATPYPEFKPFFQETLAFIVGSEDSGLDEAVLALSQDQIYIPMAGEATCFAAGMALAIVASHFAYVEKGKS